MTADRHRRRAFTLLEVLVGLTVNAIVLTAAISVFAFATTEQRVERVRAQLGREGAALGQLLQNELRLAGLGRPLGRAAPGTVGDIPVHVLVSQRESLAILADLPRPDANASTFGILHDRPAGVDHVMWHTDANGSCAPDTTLGSCSTADASVLFPGEAGCAAAGAVGDRTCAWAQKRLRAGEHFQIVGGDGTFFRAHVNNMTLEASPATDGGGVLALALDPARPFPASWPNDARGDAPVDIRGQGWVTTIDRVFYRYVAARRAFERRQCWGDFNIQDANWPPRATSTTATSIMEGGALDPAAVPDTECTPWETMARDVASVRFDYFNSVHTNLGTPGPSDGRAAITRVTWTIRLERMVNGRRVGHDVLGSVRMRNN